MNETYLTKRRALLHRQAAELLRQDAARHDSLAREIDGELSEYEKEEIILRLRVLIAETKVATARLSR